MFKINNYKKIVFAVAVIIILGVLAGQGALAGQLGDEIILKLGVVRDNAKLPTTNEPVVIVSKIIQGLLGVIAIVFFVLIIAAGFKWMTAGGSEETITKSKKIIGNALIGLLVVMFSYAITYFVLDVILNKSAV